mgnify:CR=1 FL=1
MGVAKTGAAVLGLRRCRLAHGQLRTGVQQLSYSLKHAAAQLSVLPTFCGNKQVTCKYNVWVAHNLSRGILMPVFFINAQMHFDACRSNAHALFLAKHACHPILH